MKYLIITDCNGFGERGYAIRAELDGLRLSIMRYYGYSKRDAVRMYREKYNLKYKKLVKVEY